MISVIIPIYNAEPYLSHTFHCLLTQSFPDFEVLLINDGSTDDSGVLCNAIARRDSRFHHLPQENGGVSSARNRGISAARGEYITFLDADDDIPANYLECLLAAAEQTHSQMAVCDVAVITDGAETSRFSCKASVLSQTQALNHILSRRYINSGPYAKLFRRDVISEITFPPLKAYEDILFVLEATCRCTGIAVTVETEYRYIQNSSGAMGSFLKMPSADIITATEKILTFLQSRRDLSPLCFYITASHLMQYVQEISDVRDYRAVDFLQQARGLYRKHLSGLLSCSAFPWKEKILFSLFAFGLICPK